MKSGARSQQLLLLRLRQVKTAELLNLAKSQEIVPSRPRVCRINLKKKGAATRVRPKINLVESFDKLEFQRVSKIKGIISSSRPAEEEKN